MAFNIPAQTSLALQRPTNPQPAWTRPADWPVITDNPDEVQYLVADTFPSYSIVTYFTNPASQNLYIDWGDGTTDTISSTIATTNHTYTAGTGTVCSRGYTTFKIRVYTDTGATIDYSVINRSTTGKSNTPTGTLEAVYGNNCNAGITYGFDGMFNSSGNFNMLEYVKLPTTILSSGFNNTFLNCFSLAKIVMPTSMANVTNMTGAFRAASALQSITIPALPVCTTLETIFYQCASLTSITLASSYPEVTRCDQMFFTAYSLTSIVMPSLPKCTNYSSTFNGARSLLQVQIPTWPTAINQTVTVSDMFSGCRSLANIIFPNTAASGILFSGQGIFFNCSSLVSIVLPSYFNIGTLLLTFGSCTNLQSVILPTSMPALSILANAFNACSSLQNITLPTTVSSSISFDNAFINCSALSKVDVPQGWNITSMGSAFNGCSNLTSVTLPTGSQNSLTTMVSAFNNCYALQTVTMPSSLNACTTMASIFNNCYNLQSVTLPSSLNAVTTMATAFNNCFSLETIGMPVSMSACTTFNSAIYNCAALLGTSGSTDTFTMPAVVATSSLYTTTFGRTYNLKNIVLPTTQTTAATAAAFSNCFNECFALQSITNLDKVGNTASGTLIDGTGLTINSLNITSSLSLSSRLSKLDVSGLGIGTQLSALPGLRLTNVNTGQWTGSSPQINISNTSLSTAALNTLFADMAAQGNVTSKTINISNCTGAAGLTAGDRLVITSKGWTITG